VVSAVVSTVDIAVVEDVWGAPFEELAGRFSVERRPEAWSDRRELLRVAGSARALVVRNRTRVDRDLLSSSKRLEVVARAGVGLDNVDLDAADGFGIVVVSAPGANARSVAEHALGMALALERGITQHDRSVREGAWERSLGRELAGSTWGVVGLGSTGRAMAGVARSFGMEVCGHDPFVVTSVEGVEVLPGLYDLLERSDVVSLHLALSDATQMLVDARFLGAMKPGALLVNVARGGLVDEDALADVLEAGRLGGAALDVRSEEPPVLGRLERSERVVLTPHVAGLTVESQRRVAEMLASDMEAVLLGREAANPAGRLRMPLPRS
jgi:D-3-phosphoglycerate dehydrogenase/(S)-sulfolactate dehydrogenase